MEVFRHQQECNVEKLITGVIYEDKMTKDQIIKIIINSSIFHGNEGTSGYYLNWEQAENIYIALIKSNVIDNNQCPKCGSAWDYQDDCCIKCGPTYIPMPHEDK